MDNNYLDAAFSKFIMDNNLIPTTAGVLVAYSAWDLIQSFADDVALPGLGLLFESLTKEKSAAVPHNRMDVPKFVSRLMSFFLVLFVTFLIIEYLIANFGPGADSPPSSSTSSQKSPGIHSK